jgi:hypothetical protein
VPKPLLLFAESKSITLVYEKNAIFCQKLAKNVIITSTPIFSVCSREDFGHVRKRGEEGSQQRGVALPPVHVLRPARKLQATATGSETRGSMLLI